MTKVLGLVVVPSLVLGVPALAQPEIDWWTVNGGGGVSSGGTFEVTGTAGQPDAGSTSDGTFDLQGGFWYEEHPFVPVELQWFEISSCPAVDLTPGARVHPVSCRLDGEASDAVAEVGEEVQGGGSGIVDAGGEEEV